MFSVLRGILVAAALAFGGLFVAVKADPPAAVGADDARNADVEAIRKSSIDFVEAFNRQDAKAAAAGWTKDGEYHGQDGETVRGRDRLEKEYVALFGGKKKCRIALDIGSIRFLSKDSAIEEGVVRETPVGEGLPIATNYRAFHVREDGSWKTAVVQEWAADEAQLDDVAWLVGEWTSSGKGRNFTMTFEWNPKKTAVRNHFTMKMGDKLVTSGTQNIVLDPQSHKIRSWMFDDEGDRGESIWTNDGNRWLLETRGVLPDGRETTAINIISRQGDDEYLWQSTQRTVDGQRVPDAEPIKMSRVKSAK